MAITKTYISCEEFERIAHALGPCELIDGEIVQLAPGGFEHSVVSTNIAGILREFVKAKRCGWVLGNEAGIHIRKDPARSRGMDVAYLSYKRLPKDVRPAGFITIPPELVVEVLGEGKTWEDLENKIQDYHGIGIDLVWVADPHTRTVKVFPRGKQPYIVHDGSEIDGGDALPGFKVPIAEFFD